VSRGAVFLGRDCSAGGHRANGARAIALHTTGCAGLETQYLAMPSCRAVSALNQVVNRLDHGLAKIDAGFLDDGHHRLAELIEGLLRLPDVEYLELVAGAEASVIQTPSGFACTSCVQTPDDFVVLRCGCGYRVDVHADRHESLPELAASCGRTSGSYQDAYPAARSCSGVFHTTDNGARARMALQAGDSAPGCAGLAQIRDGPLSARDRLSNLRRDRATDSYRGCGRKSAGQAFRRAARLVVTALAAPPRNGGPALHGLTSDRLPVLGREHYDHWRDRKGWWRGNVSSAAISGAGAPPVITVEHVRKAYGATVAVDDVSFSVRRGEIFGILGRNGAGKTTTVECISGLRIPDAGEVRVLGLEPRQDREQLHERLGVQLQQSALPPKLRVGEAVQLYASFYDRPADAAKLLERLGLEAKRGSYWRALSGGQKQRLSIALALIGQPEVAVLDELTTGLDPEARRETWDLIAGVRDSGVTIVLVTHFMDEAERLCDRVALIDQGKLIAIGKPAELAGQAATARRVRLRAPGQRGEQVLRELPEVSAVEHHGSDVVVVGSGNLVTVIVLALDRAGLVADDVRTETGNLEDAFLALTARTGDNRAGAGGPAAEPARP